MPRHIRYRTPTDESSEIVFRLERYDDMFSDFDIRPYSSRSLSIDFLGEIKRAARDKHDGGIKLTLYVPQKRNESREATIKERISGHFKKHHKLLLDEKRRVLRTGIGMVFMGVISMIAATYILSEDPTHNLLLSFFVVFLEPAAWFLLWEGSDQIVFSSREINPELEFYKKMSHSRGHIRFKSY